MLKYSMVTDCKLKRRSRLRFGLASLLGLVTICGIVLGLYVNPAKRQRANVQWIIQNGAGVIYGHRYDANGKYQANPQTPKPVFIHDWLGVDYVDHVQIVDLSRHEISDLSPLKKMPSVTSLWAWETKIEDTTQIVERFPNLETLHLANSPVDDVKPLAALRHLKNLNLKATQINDLVPLGELENLESLTISKATISEEAISKLKLKLPNCRIVVD